MAITYEGGAVPTGNPTTSFSITVPAAAALGDLLCLEFTHRGTGDGTVTDNSGDGVSWTRKDEALFASGTFTVQHYYKRVTAAMVGGGDTVSVTGLTNASAGVLTIYRGALASGDPFEAWTPEANASGDESHAAITTLTNGAWVVLVVGNSPDLSVTSPSTTSPGALSIRQEKLSTGGTDASVMHASAEKASAGSTGALTWAQTDAASGSIAYAIKPQLPSATAVAEVDLAAGSTPDTRTDHSLWIRARTTAGAGTMRAALYEGATNRSGDLESGALTTSLADYELAISDANAANITDYTNLSVRFWGYAADGGAIVFEVDQLWLQIPAAAGAQEIAVGVAPEEDTAGAVLSQKLVAATVAAEEDAAATVGASLAVAVTVAAEEDTAVAVTAVKQAAVGVAAEEDTALEVLADQTQQIAVGVATEEDAAQTVTAEKHATVTVAAEEDAATTITAEKQAASSPAIEEDAAVAVGSAMAVPVTVAAEEDAAVAVTAALAAAVTVAAEEDLAPDVTASAPKYTAVGVASEEDAASAVGAEFTVPVTVAAEDDTAQNVGAALHVVVDPAEEDDTAPDVGNASPNLAPVGVASEEDTAPAVGVFEPPPPGGTGSGQMIPVTRVRRQLVAVDQAMELDHAIVVRAVTVPNEEEEIARLILLGLV